MAFSVTDRAATALASMLAHAQRQPGQAIRLATNDQGKLRFYLDKPVQGDHIIHHGEAVLMVLEATLHSSLADRQLDLAQAGQERSWVLKRPAKNAATQEAKG